MPMDGQYVIPIYPPPPPPNFICEGSITIIIVYNKRIYFYKSQALPVQPHRDPFCGGIHSLLHPQKSSPLLHQLQKISQTFII